jgi:hypothetical protein
MPGRKEFRLGLQPVFQVPADGLARSHPKLVSPLGDFVAANLVLVLGLIFLVGCCLHAGNISRTCLRRSALFMNHS